MTIPPILWLVYVLAGVVLEVIAITSGEPGDTLTETTVRFAAGAVGAVAVLGFLAWALVHFARRLRWSS